ncbi:MAG: ABC transporter permease [Candidatus Rokuibacteriota bacterium]
MPGSIPESASSASTLAYPWSPTWRRLRDGARDLPVVPVTILGVAVLAALFADGLAPHDPVLGNLRHRHRPPTWLAGGDVDHLLGTDHLGRDVLSRLIFGTRISLLVGFTAAVVAGALGTAVGIISGYYGRWVDQVIMRVVDAWLALPAISFAIFLAVLLGPSEMNIVIILAGIFWTRYARVIRGEVLSLKERDYVRLAVVAGCTKWTIMRRHILPNVINTSIVLSSLIVGVVIVAEAALSFLGVGVPPPKPAWGLMLADGKEGMMAGYWWVTLFPGLAIMLVVLAANLLGDWLRVRLDPQLRQL